MSRFIDADALLEKLKSTPRYFDVKHDIEEMPTAYDVEKVVMNLRCDAICPNCAPSCSDALICGASEVIKQAIEIVRSGGVE